MRICVLWTDSSSLAKFCRSFLVFTALGQHQAHVVVGLGIIRTQTESFAKLSENLVASSAFAAKQETEHVVEFWCVWPFCSGCTKSADRSVPVRRRHCRCGIESGFELRQASLRLSLVQENYPKIDEGGCSGWGQRESSLE